MGSKLVALIVIVLGVVAIAQLTRLYELASKLRNKGEHEISSRDNRLNAKLMLGFMAFLFLGFIWLMLRFGWTGRGEAASVHGHRLDWLLNVNYIIIIFVFFVTNFLLFYFTFKYIKKPGVKAYYFPHSNKLEMLWTIVPAIVLAGIIVLGLIEWNNATSKASDDAIVIELYSKQFDWTARYAGEDNILGKFDYKVTSDKNLLGIVNTETIAYSIDKMLNDTILGINALQKRLNDKHIMMVPEIRDADKTTLHRNEDLYRLLVQMQNRHDKKLDKASWDDIIIQGPAEKLYLCKGQEYEFNFRSKDVIHSAYFPHFRAQMNTVPGQTTRFKFTPDKTTKEMRKLKNDSKFEYVLMCNKICGGSHYKMYMIVEVLEKEEYEAVMKGFDLGSDNSKRPEYDQLTAKQSQIIAKKFGAAGLMPHRFDKLFHGEPAAPVVPEAPVDGAATLADSLVVVEPVVATPGK